MQKDLKLLPGFLHPFGVCGVDDVDEGIGVGDIVAPILPQSFLSSDVPNVEFKVVVKEVFDVEALCWGGGGDVLR